MNHTPLFSLNRIGPRFMPYFRRALLIAGLAAGLCGSASRAPAYPPGTFPPGGEQFSSAEANDTCRPVLDRDENGALVVSGDTRALTIIGYDNSSCCGASRHCEKLRPTCFPPGSQQAACAIHDRCLFNQQVSATSFHDPRSTECHRQLADQSTSLPIATVMRVLQRTGQAVQAIDRFTGRAPASAEPVQNVQPSLPTITPRAAGTASRTAGLKFE